MKKTKVLINGLRKEISKKKLSFHSPGHKGKIDMMNEDFFEMDYTSDMQKGIFADTAKTYLNMSQNQVANLYRTQRVFYLANGVTSGILTMLTLCTKEGDKIIVDRNCHKSVINAIVLLGLIPIFITGTYIHRYDFCAGITYDDVTLAINDHPDAKAVFITSPSYFGMVSDIKSISILAHENKMYLLVDETLGGHFSFSQRLPASASKLGADMVVQSVSKTLGSLNGTGVLHISTNDFTSNKINEILNMYQTSNPSYAIYSVLEKSIFKALSFGRKYRIMLKTISECASYVNKCSNAYWVDEDIKSTVFDVDFTKIVINFTFTSLSGYDVARILNEKYFIEVELCDEKNITCMVTPYNKISDIKKLAKAIVAIDEKSSKVTDEINYQTRNPIHNLKITPRSAFFEDGDFVNIEDSIGKIAKNVVGICPSLPPILVPGEEITELHIKSITDCENQNIEGLREDGMIEVVKNS